MQTSISAILKAVYIIDAFRFFSASNVDGTILNASGSKVAWKKLNFSPITCAEYMQNLVTGGLGPGVGRGVGLGVGRGVGLCVGRGVGGLDVG